MWKRLGLATLVGVALGGLTIYWETTPFEMLMRLLSYVIFIGIPAALALFAWAALTRR